MLWPNDTVIDALDFAVAAHGAQKVPGSDAPYVVHLVKVATEVACAADGSFDAEFALCTALLHDCIEDAAVSREDLGQRFGTRVADAVWALSKNPSLPKPERMADSLARIRLQPREAWLVKLADRITNLAQPPATWTTQKRQAYVEEAGVILQTLGPAHAGLAKRLSERIVNYAAWL
jgi:(p)ppGpp synthase/HD superfamily hydrolase